MADDDKVSEFIRGADAHRASFFRRLREEDLKVHRETIEQQRGLIKQLRESACGYHRQLSEQAEAESSRLRAENDELARSILELQRKLTIAEKRTKHAEGNLQNAYNLAEMWRGRYESQRNRQTVTLPLAYFPAGEDPAARWGLTELGERALRDGAVEGPEWVLLVSPDPREVLSIEVRAGSRQETIYRAAGWRDATEAEAGGHFLGLLEAFVEVAKTHDEELGQALHHLETLDILGLAGMGADALQRLVGEVKAAPPPGGAPSYDLGAICARCGREYRYHLLPEGQNFLPCSGFLAAAEEPLPGGLPHRAFEAAILNEATPLGAADFEQEDEP